MELKGLISPYANVLIDERDIVQDWRSLNTTKYSKIPGIRSLHDFMYVPHPVTSAVVARVRKSCHSGPFEHSMTHILKGISAEECIFPDQEHDTYTALGKKSLTESKMNHLQSMYKDFIPPDRHLLFINIQ